MNDRFVVGSVTGWAITPASIGSSGNRTGNAKPGIVWYVWDKAYGYEIVAEFRTKMRKGGRQGETISGEEQARALAERLNREHAA
jgi:hypothetical protein